MFRRWLPLLLVVCATSACGGGGPEGPAGDGRPSAAVPDPEPGEELVAWVEEFCTVPEAIPDFLAYDFAATTRSDPTVEEDREPLLDALAEADQTMEDLDEAAAALLPGPEPAADEAVEQYRTEMEESRAQLAEYAEFAPDYPVEDLGGLYVLSGLTVIELPIAADMPSYFPEDAPGLVAASESAPSCGADRAD